MLLSLLFFAVDDDDDDDDYSDGDNDDDKNDKEYFWTALILWISSHINTTVFRIFLGPTIL
jgi:hypothetical protein